MAGKPPRPIFCLIVLWNSCILSVFAEQPVSLTSLWGAGLFIDGSYSRSSGTTGREQIFNSTFNH